MKKLLSAVAVVFFVLWGVLWLDLPKAAQDQASSAGPEVIPEVAHAVSEPVRDLPPSAHAAGPPHTIPLLKPFGEHGGGGQVVDPELQTLVGPLVSTTTPLSFLGVGVGLGNYTDCCAPPDTNGAAGATQFVQWVNVDFAVFSKTGTLIHGPVAGNSLWSNLGGQCAAHNDGDPIAQYDKAAGRWVLAQPVFHKPYTFCIAVSQTSDATGRYNLYAFPMPNFPDYPKLGVWPDGYYASFNMFKGNRFVGGQACAYNRAAMLAGSASTQVCFQLAPSFGNLLPSDLDGATAPPTGEPNFFLNFGSNSLNLWKFHANFALNAFTFTGPTNLPVAAFSEACGGGVCIPQTGTSQQLDSLGDRVMYRLAYRNFTGIGAHESLVVNHSVFAGTNGSSNTGVRWYELRSPNGTPTVFQSGTFAPDTDYRWMGSIAMDKTGDIALGYSVSSSSIHPQIHFTGRLPTDTLGTLESEANIIDGAGSQNGGLNRWGDYSSMAIDPADDCTFWYTTEYLESNGSFNWSTRIASFKFTTCK